MFRYRLFTVLVLLVPAVCHAQVELPPGVDYPRVNVGTGYQVDESWPAGKSAYPSTVALNQMLKFWTFAVLSRLKKQYTGTCERNHSWNTGRERQ